VEDLYKLINASVGISVTENNKRVGWTLDTDLNGEVSLIEFLKFTKASLITIASEALKEEQAKGFDKKPVVSVDNKVGKPIINVNPLGRIDFISRADVSGIILEVYDAILSRSPVDTGQYKSLNIVMFNGRMIANSKSQLEAWFKTGTIIKDTDVFRFINLAPYARKLERQGITSSGGSRRQVLSRRDRDAKKGKKILAPNGTYFLAYRAIKRKFKKNSLIKFGMTPGSFISGINSIQARGPDGKPLRRSYKKTGRPYLYPSITIGVDAEGVL